MIRPETGAVDVVLDLVRNPGKQDLPYFYADNLKRDPIVLDEIYFGRSVIAGLALLARNTDMPSLKGIPVCQ